MFVRKDYFLNYSSSFFEVINVSHCCLGTIPKALSTLKKLEGLYLFDNYIEGKKAIVVFEWLRHYECVM